MKYLITCIVFLSSLALINCVYTCNTQTDCTSLIPTSNSVCNSHNFCECQDFYIFNCTSLATVVFTGSSTLTLFPNSMNYFILSNVTDQTIDYLLTLTDNTQTDMLNNYTIYLFIDNGFGTSADVPTAITVANGSQLKIDAEVKLGTMPGTNIAQSLIMGIYNKQNYPALVSLNFNFALVGNSNALLIVAYAGGAVCLCVTLILMIVVYRKRNAQTNPHQRQANN